MNTRIRDIVTGLLLVVAFTLLLAGFFGFSQLAVFAGCLTFVPAAIIEDRAVPRFRQFTSNLPLPIELVIWVTIASIAGLMVSLGIGMITVMTVRPILPEELAYRVGAIPGGFTLDIFILTTVGLMVIHGIMKIFPNRPKHLIDQVQPERP